jgi:hypothetical protein
MGAGGNGNQRPKIVTTKPTDKKEKAKKNKK